MRKLTDENGNHAHQTRARREYTPSIGWKGPERLATLNTLPPTALPPSLLPPYPRFRPPIFPQDTLEGWPEQDPGPPRAALVRRVAERARLPSRTTRPRRPFPPPAVAQRVRGDDTRQAVPRDNAGYSRRRSCLVRATTAGQRGIVGCGLTCAPQTVRRARNRQHSWFATTLGRRMDVRLSRWKPGRA